VHCDVTPFDVGLGMFTRKTGSFIGYEAMISKKTTACDNCIVSLLFDNDLANPLGYEPLYLGNRIIGKTTSCSYGYRVNKPVALAHISGGIEDGAIVDVDIAGTRYPATVNHKALFDDSGRAMKITW